MDTAIVSRIALETAIPESSVSAAVALLQNGTAGPFIARYRREATGGLDEIKIRIIQDRLAHYREVLDLRAALLKTLAEQGTLDGELQAKIEGCLSKSELDDMQHRLRPRKKTRALEALEKGLEPLAEYFWKQESDGRSIDEHLEVFVDPAKGVLNREQALQGAVDILAEWIWEKAECRQILREMFWGEGQLVSSVVPAKIGQKTKYNMYYDRREPVFSVPSHRVLAIRRGCKEGVLVSAVEGDNAKAMEHLLSSVLKNNDDRKSEIFSVLEIAVRESYNRILRPTIEAEVRMRLKERADREAIKVFQENLSNLLLAPPAGPIVVMSLDVGKGRECSVAVIDGTGGFLEGAKIRLTEKTAVPGKTAALVSDTTTEGSESADIIEGTAEDAPAEFSETAEDAPAEFSKTAEDAPAEFSKTAQVAVEIESDVLTENTADPSETQIVFAENIEDTTEQASASDGLAASEIVYDDATLSSRTTPSIPTINAPAAPENITDPRVVLKDLITRHNVQAVAIGAGTNVRELENLLRQVIAEEGLSHVFIASVNDAGLAIYSSSRHSREEFPDKSASARCALSLARRLQDPLSELVKLDPKMIGVGQYQHDVDQKELHRALTQTVQFCVNNVGVNLNTAEASLLRYVSGLNDKLARRIVAVRSSQGPFASRAAMNEALKLEPFVYEQAAAFLRVTDGENVLDQTAVHPESYPIVEKIAEASGVSVGELIGNRERIEAVNLNDYITETVGLPTLTDIREELLRPGRDPRRSFKLPKFSLDIKEMSDLKIGMALEGIVTNVTNFGAFVDIGVRQDGLVHLSQMSSRFIRDPREAVKVGDVVEVKVISVDSETRRIGLSMKTAASSNAQRRRPRPPKREGKDSSRGDRNAGAGGSAKAAKEAGKESEATSGRSSRRGDRNASPRRDGKRLPRRPERSAAQSYETSSAEQAPAEPVYEGPEPSFEEKIAILQSRFRGIK